MLSKIIRNFIAKRVAGRSDDGIMITLKDPKKVDLETAKFQELLMRNGIDPMAITNENQIKNIINQINKPKVVSQENPKFKGIMSRMTGKNVIKADFGPGFKQEIEKMRGDMPPPGSRGGKDDIAAPVQSAEESTTNLTDSTIQNMLKMEPIDAMKEANKVIKREGIYKALNKKQAKKILDDTEDHIFERNFKTPDDPDFDPESMADGGRIGYKKGTVDVARRGFMKAAAGVGAGIGALKMGALKLFGKEGTRQVTKQIIKTDNVPGKPEWFDALVTKVINEGEDMTKQFATKEREIVHATKIGKDDYVRVTQDLDNGSIRVEYDSPDNVYGDTVQLQYKKSLPDEGDPRPSAEFDVAESGPVGRSFGPDDYEIEIDEVGGTSIKDLTSDVSKLKEYAMGKKPTLKEFVQSKKRKDRAKAISEGGENEMDEVIRRQGEFIENDLVDLDPPELASGGIARMLGE